MGIFRSGKRALEIKIKQLEQQLLQGRKELQEKNDENEAQHEEYKRVNNELKLAKDNAEEIQKMLEEAQRIALVGNWYLNLNNSSLNWSKTCYSFFDIEESITENLADHVRNRINQDDLSELEKAFQSGIRQNTGFRIEFSVNTSKEKKIVLLISEPVFDAKEKLKAFKGILQDITNQKKYEDELKHSHDLMQYIIEHNRSAIAVHDKNLKYIFVSQRYLNDYKIKDKDIIGKHHYEVFPDLPQKWRDVHQKALKGEICSTEDDMYYKDDGSVVWTRWECRPWYESDKTIGGIIVYTEVITERIKMQETLRNTNATLLSAKQELQHSYDLLSNLAEQVPGVIYQYRLYPDGRSAFPYSSKGMYDIYEVTSEEVKDDASAVFTRIHPDDYQDIVDTILESARTQTLYHNEFRVILPSKGLRWRSCFARPELLNDGSTLWHGIITDITDKKEIEKELEIKNIELIESKEQLRFAFEGSNDGLWDANLKTGVVFLSARGCEILGYHPDEIVKSIQAWFELLHPDDLTFTKEKWEAHLKSESPVFEVEQRLRMKSGEYKWILARGKLVSRDQNGNPLRITGTHTDITDRKHAENEIKKLNEELEERIEKRTKELINANKELEAFSYSVSHDLRAPLRAISGYTNILMEDYQNRLDDEGKRICRVISSSAEKMGRLIDDLLSFSRWSRNELIYTSFNMMELINAVFDEMVQSYDMEKIEFSADNVPSVMGDYNMLKQVWINLISNALKYSSHQERAIIKIKAEHSANEMIFSISDNGVGFDMQYANKLFGVFQRLHNTKDFEGTGVGLAIIQRIINRHGGKVWANGELEKGATFYFSLPT